MAHVGLGFREYTNGSAGILVNWDFKVLGLAQTAVLRRYVAMQRMTAQARKPV